MERCRAAFLPYETDAVQLIALLTNDLSSHNPQRLMIAWHGMLSGMPLADVQDMLVSTH